MRSEFNAEKSWLLQEEVEEVIVYTIELAAQGPKFPESGVGKQWTYQFVEKHSDRLHVYTTCPLDTLRGWAVNEATNVHWLDLVEDIQLQGDDGQLIAPECTWAMDEAGFQANGGEGWGKVIGAKGKKIQYQQQAGSRETMMVLLTIGANGTALPPRVIFTGKGYLVKWKQDNPVKALLGYSQKGWTDNEIGIHYAKHFEGLDIVVFSPLKLEYGKFHDQLLCETGEAVSKENFLTIYGEAHLAALRPELIKTAFQKTGIIPFDQNAITADKLAPSYDTSFKVFTPVIPSTPRTVGHPPEQFYLVSQYTLLFRSLGP
ncbi:hypothetical protein BYT27DRAFT_7212612 [Phlegmacium glaucopus]|nr:hypothetical protein BYT27DRAFT_7212612 [Phlegmacium glaucopus]